MKDWCRRMNEDLINALPSGWKVIKLGDYAITQKGKKPKKLSKVKTDEFNIPYVNIKAFEKNEIDEYTDGENCVFCEDGDFLMVWDGSRSGYVGKAIKGAVGSTLVKLNFPGILNEYAYYFLQSKFLEINTRAKGTGTPHVDPSLLWNYDFPIPPIDEQQRIVDKISELFSEIEKGLDGLAVIYKQLEVYHYAILKSAYEGGFTKNWRSQHNISPSFENLLIKYRGDKKDLSLESLSINDLIEVPKLPEQWMLVRMEECIEQPKYGTSKKCNYEVTKTPVLRIPNIGDIYIDTNDLKYAEFDEEDFDKYQLREGDVLTIRSNGSISLVGKSALVRKVDEHLFYAGYLIRLRPKTNIVNPKYLLYALNSGFLRKQIEDKAKSTSGVNNINSNELKDLIIPICSVQEQEVVIEAIESRLSQCDNIQYVIDESVRKAEALKQSILKKAFEGKLVLQDSNDESKN